MLQGVYIVMKSEFDMKFIDVVDVELGAAILRPKKKFTFENNFTSSREWKKKREKFLNNHGSSKKHDSYKHQS